MFSGLWITVACTILFLLLLEAYFFSVSVQVTVLQPAGEKDPAHDERADGECGPGIKKGILKDGFGFGTWQSQHAGTPS